MTGSKVLFSTLAVTALVVTDSNGVQHNLSDFAGQKVVLEWTNEGCPYVMGRTFAAKTTPHMYIIDESQTLVYQGAIDDNRSANPATVEGAENYVLAAMNDLKAGKAVAVSETAPYGCSVKYKS